MVKDSSDTEFGYETSYDNLGLFAASGYAKNMVTFNGISTAIGSDTGASRENYESAGVWSDASVIPDGTKVRKGVHFGYYANHANAVLRSALVLDAPSYASPYGGSGFHVTLEND